MAKSSFALLAIAATTAHSSSVNGHANPIRKVVTMLQNLKAKVEGEGAKEREIHEKYMCYCKNGAASLEKSLADGGSRFPQLEADIKAAEAKKAGLDNEIANHKADQVGAKKGMEEATALRDKEEKEFNAELVEAQAELNPINQALTLLGAGNATEAGNATAAGNATEAAAPAEEAAAASDVSFVQSTFLRSGTAQALKKLVQAKSNMNDGDRGELISFLSGTMLPGNFDPTEIIGILQGMKDNVAADIAELQKAEADNIKSYEGVMAAKKAELAPIQALVEEKMMRVGEIPVDLVQMKNDLGDTGEQMVQDKKFLADLGSNCATKEKFWEENVRMRGQEIQALADTIKVLNDDDALELFKQTLPGAASLFQIAETSADMRARASSALEHVGGHNVGVDFIVMSLQGKKAGNAKVAKLIDDLVTSLKQEGQDDLEKKTYCAQQFDQADDKKKMIQGEVGDHEATIADLSSVPSELKSEIDALGDGIRDLDKSVAEATEQRKEEADDYAPLMASDAAAKELILFAKNRLNKFYNPKLHKANVRQMTDEDHATVAAGGTLAPHGPTGGIADTGITVGFDQQIPPPPEAVAAYSKKSQESNGVIALMDLLVKDLDKEMTEAEATEKNAQKSYQNFMADAATKRSKDSKALADKESALADTNARLLEVKDAKTSSNKELMAVEQYIGDLHAECDWLLKYFDMRKEIRTLEIDALKKAKAILAGADYSFLQRKTFLHTK
jgi:hypothetical protein